jgi:hypothetical protein
METGSKPEMKKVMVAVLVTAWTLGWLLFAIVMTYVGHRDGQEPNSGVERVLFVIVPRIAAAVVVLTSAVGWWLARRAQAATGLPLPGILVVVNVLMFLSAATFLGTAMMR